MLHARVPLLRLGVLSCCLAAPASASIDLDGDQLSDIWELLHGQGLAAAGDSDGDGLSNLDESVAGTDPLDASSTLAPSFEAESASLLRATWPALRGKRYAVQSSADLLAPAWTELSAQAPASSGLASVTFALPTGTAFFRVAAADIDTDGDGLSDWEELASGFNPQRVYSEGLGTLNTNTDYHRLRTALQAAASVVTLASTNSSLPENWPIPGVVVLRRTGRIDACTVGYTVTGTASAPADFLGPLTGAVTFPVGSDEVTLRYTATADAVADPGETIVVTLLPGTGYTLTGNTSATLTIEDVPVGAVSELEAARFLAQATYGPTANEIARVRSLGFSAWLDDQFNRPVGLLFPIVQAWHDELYRPLSDPAPNNNPTTTMHRMDAWWRRAMADDTSADPLRQRVTFALSELFVVSDRMESIRSDQRALADFWDTLASGAFGTYRELLEQVTLHHMMGRYLSHYRNRKADPALNRYPDENYAREVMQLFSIGLWELNPDGSQVLSDGTTLGPDGETIPAGEAIPTYGQDLISTFARVFTGLSSSQRTTSGTDPTPIATTTFFEGQGIAWEPMRMFDIEHDLAPKTLFGGVTLPQRTLSSGNGSTAGTADLEAALDNLAAHPNVGPFLSRLLIQRLVKSNPSPAYIARVSAVFANNGAGVRGDLRAVLKAILLDDEARSAAALSDPQAGMVREPYVRLLAFARAVGARPMDMADAVPTSGGRYRNLDTIDSDFLQRPQSAPSVFNFFSPGYQPPGALRDAGLVSPEMQIVNSVSAITLPNRFSSILFVSSVGSTPPPAVRFNPSAIADDAGTVGIDESRWNIGIDETAWIADGQGDVDALVSKLNRLFCYGQMSDATFRAIARAVRRLDDPAGTSTTTERTRRAIARYRVALHLVLLSPDAAVLR